jgi:ABC-type uncharacterized transport system substrate-binding protein
MSLLASPFRRVGTLIRESAMRWHVWQSRSRLRIGRVLLVMATCLSASVAPFSRGDDPPQSRRVAILFGARESYRSAAASLETSLKAAGIECVTAELPKREDDAGRGETLARLRAAKPAVIATAGIGATSFVLGKGPKTPVVFFMVPNARDAAFMKDGSAGKDRVAGVTTDASPEDQLAWIARLRPAFKHIAILHSSRTKQTVKRFEAASRKQKIAITAIESDKNEFPEAIEALNASGCDGVLMIPDARVYSVATIQRMLLWGLRQKKPVWTFSANVVKAGALAGMYSDTDKAAQQTAELIGRILDGVDPGKIGLQYPRDVCTAVNMRTAKMIEVSLDDKVVRAETVKFGEEP